MWIDFSKFFDFNLFIWYFKRIVILCYIVNILRYVKGNLENML